MEKRERTRQIIWFFQLTGVYKKCNFTIIFFTNATF